MWWPVVATAYFLSLTVKYQSQPMLNSCCCKINVRWMHVGGAFVRATTVVCCMLMKWGLGGPCREPNALLQMVIHRDTSPRLLNYFLTVWLLCPPIVWRIYEWRCRGFRVQTFPAPSSLLFLTAGASHARLPTPPQAQQDLLVLTMPAPQGSRVACWVPHFNEGIPVTAVGLPQECFLTTASVTGTGREHERERVESGQGNTVIRSEETVAQTNSGAYSHLSNTTFAASCAGTTAKTLKGHFSCADITPLEMLGELKPSNRFCHLSALRPFGLANLFFSSGTSYITCV